MHQALKIEDVSKVYRLGQVGTGTLSHDLNRWWAKLRGRPDPALKVSLENDHATAGGQFVWALKDISFTIPEGQILGIVGGNGAGKSTLLKLLSRVTGPTTGTIQANGRMASLLEVGTGFHPELTGRENIFLNGAILGMTKPEIKRHIDEIVEFSGCAKYIDTPVKRYSSGMTVRLGFAVAAHLNCEILVVDEVLAVGDAAFQRKCIGKMQELGRNQGRTILFVSHNMASISQLCSRAILFRQGRLIADGLPNEVIQQYFRSTSADVDFCPPATTLTLPPDENKGMRLIKVSVTDQQGNLLEPDVPFEGAMEVEIEYEIRQPDQEAYVVCCFTDMSGADAWWQYDGDSEEFGKRAPGIYRARVEMPKGFLRAGQYLMRPSIVRLGGAPIDYHGALFHVTIGDSESKLAQKNIQWPSLVRYQAKWETVAIRGER